MKPTEILNKDSKERRSKPPYKRRFKEITENRKIILWKGSENDEVFIEKVKKEEFQAIGKIISGLVDSKSDLKLKKPFQKAGKL